MPLQIHVTDQLRKLSRSVSVSPTAIDDVKEEPTLTFLCDVTLVQLTLFLLCKLPHVFHGSELGAFSFHDLFGADEAMTYRTTQRPYVNTKHIPLTKRALTAYIDRYGKWHIVSLSVCVQSNDRCTGHDLKLPCPDTAGTIPFV